MSTASAASPVFCRTFLFAGCARQSEVVGAQQPKLVGIWDVGAPDRPGITLARYKFGANGKYALALGQSGGCSSFGTYRLDGESLVETEEGKHAFTSTSNIKWIY